VASTNIERTNVNGMNEILGQTFPCLDHGFVRVIDYMGDDAAVVQAARVSYGDGTKSSRDDRGLIRYLMKHRHTSPFEMCELKLHVKLPMFIARQWIRHRTANVNEISGRYSILKNEVYVPDLDNLQEQSKDNKQGRGDRLDPLVQLECANLIENSCQNSFDTYDKLLDTGLAREVSRIVQPLNTYTEWYWKVDLHNLMHFLALRIDGHAQYEIRVYAEAIANIVKQWMPVTYEAFMDYRVGTKTLTTAEIEVIKRLIGGENKADIWNSGVNLSRREYRELMQTLEQ
jgi:thymidylate synthase (FAD)